MCVLGMAPEMRASAGTAPACGQRGKGGSAAGTHLLTAPFLLQQIPSELISLDPRQLGTVDTITMEQQQQERAERLVRGMLGCWRDGCCGLDFSNALWVRGLPLTSCPLSPPPPPPVRL